MQQKRRACSLSFLPQQSHTVLSLTPFLFSWLLGIPQSHTEPLGSGKKKKITNKPGSSMLSPGGKKGKRGRGWERRRQHLETFMYKNVFPPFPVQELPFWHFRHGLITHRTVINRMREEKEDGHVKRICITQERECEPVQRKQAGFQKPEIYLQSHILLKWQRLSWDVGVEKLQRAQPWWPPGGSKDQLEECPRHSSLLH